MLRRGTSGCVRRSTAAAASVAPVGVTGASRGKAMTGDDWRDMFESAGRKIANAATTFKDTRAEGQRLADRMNEWHDKNPPGSAFAQGGFTAGNNQGHRNPFSSAGGGAKKSMHAEDPLYPANFKKRIEQSQDMVERESMKELPRKLTYGLLLVLSVVTIFMNLVQETWFPWKAISLTDQCEYEDYVPDFNVDDDDDTLPDWAKRKKPAAAPGTSTV